MQLSSEAHNQPDSKPKIVYTSEPDTFSEYIPKIINFRHLAVALATRDLKVKFAQTWLGLAWIVLQPTVAVITYTIFFTYAVKIPTGETPYILFVLSGLSLWTLFSYIFSQGSNALLSNVELIKKMAFPKIILPISKAIVGFIDFGVAFVLFCIAWLILYANFSPKLLLFPFAIIGMLLFSLSITLLLLSFSIKQRDLMLVAPFLVYFGIWFTPVFYPVTLLPENLQQLIYLNPAAGMIDFFRWCFGILPLFSYWFIADFVVILLLFIMSVWIFKQKEDLITDVI